MHDPDYMISTFTREISLARYNTMYTLEVGHTVAQLVEALHYKRGKVAGSIPNGVIGLFIDIIIPAAL
jgi:hypothetical protein